MTRYASRLIGDSEYGHCRCSLSPFLPLSLPPSLPPLVRGHPSSALSGSSNGHTEPPPGVCPVATSDRKSFDNGITPVLYDGTPSLSAYIGLSVSLPVSLRISPYVCLSPSITLLRRLYTRKGWTDWKGSPLSLRSTSEDVFGSGGGQTICQTKEDGGSTEEQRP